MALELQWSGPFSKKKFSYRILCSYYCYTISLTQHLKITILVVELVVKCDHTNVECFENNLLRHWRPFSQRRPLPCWPCSPSHSRGGTVTRGGSPQPDDYNHHSGYNHYSRGGTVTRAGSPQPMFKERKYPTNARFFSKGNYEAFSIVFNL